MEAVSIDEAEVGNCEGWRDQNPECHMRERNRQRKKSWEEMERQKEKSGEPCQWKWREEMFSRRQSQQQIRDQQGR